MKKVFAFMCIGLLTFSKVAIVYGAEQNNVDTIIVDKEINASVIPEEEMQTLSLIQTYNSSVFDLFNCSIKANKYSGAAEFTSSGTGRLSLVLYRRDTSSGDWVRVDSVYVDFTNKTSVTLNRNYVMASGRTYKVIGYCDAKVGSSSGVVSDSATYTK